MTHTPSLYISPVSSSLTIGVQDTTVYQTGVPFGTLVLSVTRPDETDWYVMTTALTQGFCKTLSAVDIGLPAETVLVDGYYKWRLTGENFEVIVNEYRCESLYRRYQRLLCAQSCCEEYYLDRLQKLRSVTVNIEAAQAQAELFSDKTKAEALYNHALSKLVLLEKSTCITCY
jgi:hypothetical protein